jgi:hypothetical protein
MFSESEVNEKYPNQGFENMTEGQKILFDKIQKIVQEFIDKNRIEDLRSSEELKNLKKQFSNGGKKPPDKNNNDINLEATNTLKKILENQNTIITKLIEEEKSKNVRDISRYNSMLEKIEKQKDKLTEDNKIVQPIEKSKNVRDISHYNSMLKEIEKQKDKLTEDNKKLLEKTILKEEFTKLKKQILKLIKEILSFWTEKEFKLFNLFQDNLLTNFEKIHELITKILEALKKKEILIEILQKSLKNEILYEELTKLYEELTKLIEKIPKPELKKLLHTIGEKLQKKNQTEEMFKEKINKKNKKFIVLILLGVLVVGGFCYTYIKNKEVEKSDVSKEQKPFHLYYYIVVL